MKSEILDSNQEDNEDFRRARLYHICSDRSILAHITAHVCIKLTILSKLLLKKGMR